MLLIEKAKALALVMALAFFVAANDDNAVQEPEIDAAEAWEEFERLLRSHYAYLDRLGEDSADRQLARSRKLALAAETPDELRRFMHQTALTFMDPHLIVGPFDEQDFSIIYSDADLRAAYAEGRYEIVEVRRDSHAAGADVRPGWRVLSVDGQPVRQAARLPFGNVLPNPSDAQLSYGITLAVNGRRGQQRRVLFAKPDGKQVELELPAPSKGRQAGPSELVSVERVGKSKRFGRILIQNSLGDNDTIAAFDEAIAQLAEAKGLIIDLRNTPSGGNTDVARSIIGHFLTEPKPYQVHTIPAVERELGVPRTFIELASPRRPQFRGPVVVLHGTWTGSMGEGLVIGLDAAAGAYTIGSDMGDLLGALWNFDLPASGARIDMGVEKLFHPDGTPREDYVADLAMPHGDIGPDGSDPLLPLAIRYLERAARDRTAPRRSGSST
jgi:carboxyl-terminal processing protease